MPYYVGVAFAMSLVGLIFVGIIYAGTLRAMRALRSERADIEALKAEISEMQSNLLLKVASDLPKVEDPELMVRVSSTMDRVHSAITGLKAASTQISIYAKRLSELPCCRGNTEAQSIALEIIRLAKACENVQVTDANKTAEGVYSPKS